MNDLPPHPGDDAASAPPREMEIDTARGRRWRGIIGFALVFLGVAGVLVLAFVYFTASVAMSVTIVMFMLAYMGAMAWLTSRNLGDR